MSWVSWFDSFACGLEAGRSARGPRQAPAKTSFSVLLRREEASGGKTALATRRRARLESWNAAAKIQHCGQLAANVSRRRQAALPHHPCILPHLLHTESAERRADHRWE